MASRATKIDELAATAGRSTGTGGTGPDGAKDEGQSLAKSAWRRLRRNPMFLIGATIIGVFVLVALLAPWLAPHDPSLRLLKDQVSNANNQIPPPQPGHPLGGDQYGRDLLSRILLGSQQTLLVALLATVIGLPLQLAGRDILDRQGAVREALYRAQRCDAHLHVAQPLARRERAVDRGAPGEAGYRSEHRHLVPVRRQLLDHAERRPFARQVVERDPAAELLRRRQRLFHGERIAEPLGGRPGCQNDRIRLQRLHFFGVRKDAEANLDSRARAAR